MSIRNLNVIYDALIINRITYCISAYGGHLNSEQVGKVNALLKRAKKYQLTDVIFEFAGLLMQADYKLFAKCNLKIIVYITVYRQSGLFVKHCVNDVIILKFHCVAMNFIRNRLCLAACMLLVFIIR